MEDFRLFIYKKQLKMNILPLKTFKTKIFGLVKKRSRVPVWPNDKHELGSL